MSRIPAIKTNKKSKADMILKYEYTKEEFERMVKDGEIMPDDIYSEVETKIEDRRKARGLKPDQKDDWGSKQYKTFENGKYYIDDDKFDLYRNTHNYKTCKNLYEKACKNANIIVDSHIDMSKKADDMGIVTDESVVDEYFNQLVSIRENNIEGGDFKAIRQTQIAGIMRSLLDDNENKNQAAWAKAFSKYDEYVYESQVNTYANAFVELYTNDELNECFDDSESDLPLKDRIIQYAIFKAGYDNIKDDDEDTKRLMMRQLDEAYDKFVDHVEAQTGHKFAHVDLPDDQAAKAKKKADLDKPIGTENDKKHAHSLITKVGVAALIGASIKGSIDKHRVEKYKEQRKDLVEEENSAANRVQMSKSFGDVFANTFAKVMAEQKREALENKLEKIQDRIDRNKKITHKISSFIGMSRNMVSLQADRDMTEFFRTGHVSNDNAAVKLNDEMSDEHAKQINSNKSAGRGKKPDGKNKNSEAETQSTEQSTESAGKQSITDSRDHTVVVKPDDKNKSDRTTVDENLVGTAPETPETSETSDNVPCPTGA